MSSFFCRKFVFFVSFQHLVSAFFSSTTLCVAGVPSAPPLGDFRKSDRQCILSPAHAPCGSTVFPRSCSVRQHSLSLLMLRAVAQSFPAHAPCGSTHSIEFAQQIHKNREHGPGHPLLPLRGNSPCISRFLYKGRKNVPAGRGFSSASLESVVSSERLFAKQPQKSYPQFPIEFVDSVCYYKIE